MRGLPVLWLLLAPASALGQTTSTLTLSADLTDSLTIRLYQPATTTEIASPVLFSGIILDGTTADPSETWKTLINHTDKGVTLVVHAEMQIELTGQDTATVQVTGDGSAADVGITATPHVQCGQTVDWVWDNAGVFNDTAPVADGTGVACNPDDGTFAAGGDVPVFVDVALHLPKTQSTDATTQATVTATASL